MSERIKAQRTPSGKPLGACIAVSADDLSFIGSGVEWLTIEKTTGANALLIKITDGDAPCG